MKTTADPTLVPTERHVERLGLAGATTPRRLFDKLSARARPGRRVATFAASRLASLVGLLEALEAGTSPLPRDRVAIVAGSIAEALGALADAGTTPAALSRTGTPRGRILAAARERQGEILSAAGLEDPALQSQLTRVAAGFGPPSLDVRCTAGFSTSLLASLSSLHVAGRRAGGRGVSIALPRVEGDESWARVADRVERQLSSVEDAPELEWFELRPPERVSIVEARSLDAEARAIAHRVASALAAGVAPDRIAIAIPPRDESLGEPLRAALADAGVPFSEAYGPPIDRSPEARAALSLLEMTRGRLRRDAIIELLGTPGIHAGSWVATRDEATAARRAAKVGRRLREIPLVADANGRLFVELLAAMSRDQEDDEGFVPGAIERLAASIGALRAAPNPVVLARELAEMIDRLRLGEPSADELRAALSSEAGGHGRLALAAIGEGAVAVRAVLTALDDFSHAVSALGVDPARLTAEDLSAELDNAVRGARSAARGAAGRAGAVRVGPPREIAGLEHDLVIVTRMLTRAWSPADQHGLLDEATRERLPEGARPHGHRERADLCDVELGWALASAREVVLTYTPFDDEGRDTEPAHALVKRAVERGADRMREPGSKLAGNASRASPHDQELARLAANASPPPDLAARVAIENERARFFTDPGTTAGRFSGAISTELEPRLREMFRGDSRENPISVTSLEEAASCPFRAFAHGVLGARRAEEAEDALSPRERGTALHRALQAAFDAVRDLPPSADDERRLEAGRVAMHRALELDAPASALRRDARERTAAEALAVLKEELAAPRDLTYAMGERAFGRGAVSPWDSLGLPPGDAPELWVGGQIDRVDFSPDRSRARIVDYKSGAKLPNPKAPGALQLRLYALAVSRLGVEEVTSMYVGVGRNGAVKTSPGRSKLAPFSDEEMDEAIEVARLTARGLWTGHVEPRPIDPRICKRCEARDICRRPAVIAGRDDDDEKTKTAAEPEPT